MRDCCTRTICSGHGAKGWCWWTTTSGPNLSRAWRRPRSWRSLTITGWRTSRPPTPSMSGTSLGLHHYHCGPACSQERGLMPSEKMGGATASAIVFGHGDVQIPYLYSPAPAYGCPDGPDCQCFPGGAGQVHFFRLGLRRPAGGGFAIYGFQRIPHRRPFLRRQPNHLCGLSPSAGPERGISGSDAKNHGGEGLQHDDPHANRRASWREHS